VDLIYNYVERMLQGEGNLLKENLLSTVASTAHAPARATVFADRWPALAVLLLGLVIVYGVGFSPFQQAHNAAHDTRHANGFPCH
jgi:cobalt transporter subunit CbtB